MGLNDEQYNNLIDKLQYASTQQLVKIEKEMLKVKRQRMRGGGMVG